MPDRRRGVGEHPSVEVLSAYVDGTLEVRERGDVETHLAACEECYELVTEVVASEADIDAEGGAASPAAPPRVSPAAPDAARDVASPVRPSSKVLPLTRRRWVLGAVAGLAAAAALVLVVAIDRDVRPIFRSASTADPRLEQLIAATAADRPIEARLAGGFSHSPFVPPARSGDTPNLSLLSAAGRLQQAAKSGGLTDRHAFALALILVGRSGEAVPELESLTQSDPSNAKLLNDLAAAYVARGLPQDLPRALAAIDQALANDADLDEAYFNRALVMSSLGLRDTAVAAWNEFLKRDAESGWAEEGRRRRDEILSKPLSDWNAIEPEVIQVARADNRARLDAYRDGYAQRMREFLEDSLLPQWARNATSDGAAVTVALAESLSGLGDRMPLDTVAQIKTFESATAQRQALLRQGLSRFGEARGLYEKNRIAEAMRLFAEAKSSLEQTGSPLALWCDLHLGIGAYYQGRHADVHGALTDLIVTAQKRTYLALAARAHWVVALNHSVKAEHSLALDNYRSALAIFERLREAENVAAVHNLIAGVLLYLGDDNGVWAHTIQALRARTPPGRRRHTQLVSAANKATRNGLAEAALVLADEAKADLTRWSSVEAQVEVEQFRARALRRLGREREAEEAVTAARTALNLVSDPILKPRLAAEVKQTEAEVYQSIDPTRAASAAGDAIAFFAGRSTQLRVPRLYLLQGRAIASSGDLAGAKRSFEEGILHFERERANIPISDELRISHFDDAWQVFEEMLDVSSKDATAASEMFQLAERGRARTLHESIASHQPNPTPESLAKSLPPNTAMLYFLSLRDRTLVWVITSSGPKVHSLDLTKARLRELSLQFRTSLVAKPSVASWQQAAGTLRDALIAPLGIESEVSQLVIVPDDALHQVAFAALWDKTTQHYLVQDYILAIAPSAGFWLSSAARQARIDKASVVLSVGVGLADGQAGLPALPRAEAEALLVREAFPNSSVFVGHDATEANIRKLGKPAEVFHFAGHAVANPEFPATSRLLFSDGARGTTPVTAAALGGHLFRGVKVAVMSACSTMRGPIRGSEGAISLSRALLTSGVPTVVATLWDVSDAAAFEVVSAFYRHLSTAGSARVALSESLRDYVRRHVDEGPSSWAMWAVVGAG